MNIFEESLNVLKSKMQLRKLFQDMHVEDLENIIKRVEAIHQEKLEESHAQEEEILRKREDIAAVISLMEEKGLSMDDIASAATEEKPHKGKGKQRQRYKFEYENGEGTRVQWEGATTGRIPADFNEYLTRSGKNRKDCIVSIL